MKTVGSYVALVQTDLFALPITTLDSIDRGAQAIVVPFLINHRICHGECRVEPF